LFCNIVAGVISPLLANVYLHYVFDLWAQQWRKRAGVGEVILVRYADDFVIGFQHRSEAEEFLKDLQERFKQFGLSLHPDKTRLIEFGRFAANNRKWRGAGKPETFNFLGFTHVCGKTRTSGKFTVLRKTIAKRMAAKLKLLRDKLWEWRHEPVQKLGEWLGVVVRGWLNYHAVPGNTFRIKLFRDEVVRNWFCALKRRSQKSKLTWERFGALVLNWIPHARIQHPYPSARFHAKYAR
jgi:RNA-directed DNA polymerase